LSITASNLEPQPAPSPTPALALDCVRKAFDKVAVDGLNLRVWPGELYALLGHNGAGKTTTLRMVAGLMKPDAGSIARCSRPTSCWKPWRSASTGMRDARASRAA
jgi:ABC-type multidrug transport system ATPase subunit